MTHRRPISADLRFVSDTLDTLRFANMDQNPKGIRDILGNAIYRAEKLERELVAMRLALVDAEETLALMEAPSREDPQYGAEVRALGNRIGFGALMSSASASWSRMLEASGVPGGGAFVSGPCHGTVLNTLRRVREALRISS